MAPSVQDQLKSQPPTKIQVDTEISFLTTIAGKK